MAGRLMYGKLATPVRVLTTSVVMATLVALSACATPVPNPISASPVQGRSIGVATLAFGPWEQELAPAITRAEVVARLAEAQVKDGRLPPGAALDLRAHLVAARAAMADARRGNRDAPTPDNRAALAEAIRLTDLAANLLEP